MAHPAHHHKINYIEFHSADIERTKAFYATVFGWSFKDWGPDYIDCKAEDAGVAIGFAKVASPEHAGKFAPLIVLYSADLNATETAIVAAGGSIVVPTFEFPGGRRFHFSDGAGNVLGVWSE
jgi:predicted enzyme related to lactoylglutathione lyase